MIKLIKFNMCDKLRCISCSKILNKDCGKSIDGTLLEIVGVLFENSRLEFNVGSKICENCQNSLLVGFKFKAMCVHTEDKLHPYISQMTESKERIDLKMVMANLRGTQYENAIAVNICRLCLALVDENDKQLLVEVLRKNDWEDTFKFYIPDMNLEVTEDPIICKSCLCSLEEFMANSLEFAPFKSIISDGYLENCQIQSQLEDKSKDVQEKQSGELQTNESSKTIEILTNFEKISKTGLYRCNICSKELKSTYSIKRHMHCHTNMWFKCELCSYKTRHQKFIDMHEQAHKDGVEWKKFKCSKCNFRSLFRCKVKNHERIHATNYDRSNYYKEEFKCSHCPFKTRYKPSLAHHELRHTNRWQIYKCDLCPYQTVAAHYLKKHKKRKHSDPSKVKMHTCNLCPYKTTFESNLKVHLNGHKDVSEVEMYTCYNCGLKTRYKEYLREHIMATHMHVSDTKLYKCHLCDYVAKRLSYYKIHMINRHLDESQITMYQCTECPYKTKHNPTLKIHFKNKHADKQFVYFCNRCEFETEYYDCILKHRKIEHNE